MTLSPNDIRRFRRRIWGFYKTHRRDLPFRRTTDPYCITISEIMLQQTQVDRVVPYYHRWIARWPDWQALATASKQQLLSEWSGLGYNRRAVFLGRMADVIIRNHSGRLPDEPEALRLLPGIGEYTSHAILVFAFNRPLVAVDTNIRRVILHELQLSARTPDADIKSIAAQLLPRGKARDWHYALMDYSSLALPRRLEKIPPRSRQGRFAGSQRQIRGEIIKRLTNHQSVAMTVVAKQLGRPLADVQRAAAAMVREYLVRVRQGRVFLRD